MAEKKVANPVTPTGNPPTKAGKTAGELAPGESVQLGQTSLPNQPVHDAEGTKTMPSSDISSSREKPGRLAQVVKESGLDEAHALHIEGVARALGGRNWAKLAEVLIGIIQTLKDAGILDSIGSPTPPAEPEE